MKRLLTLAFVCAAFHAAAQATSPVLIPIYYNGNGAFGSQWYTTVVVNNFSTQTITGNGLAFLTTCPIPEGCRASDLGPGAIAGLFGPDSMAGLLMHVPADEAHDVEIQAHFGEGTRNRYGTLLPVVREAGFRSDEIVLLQVPMLGFDGAIRSTLRIYSPEPDPIQVRVELLPWFTRSGPPDAMKVVTLARGDAIHPAFAQLDLQREFPGLNSGAERIRVTPLPFGDTHPRIWAFATVVENATNEVTVVAPQ